MVSNNGHSIDSENSSCTNTGDFTGVVAQESIPAVIALAMMAGPVPVTVDGVSSPHLSSDVLSTLVLRQEECLHSRDWVVCGWNVNGIRCLWRKRGLIPFLLRVFPDVLVLTELKSCLSRVPPAMFPVLQALGYRIVFWHTCEIPRSGYSGVAVLCRARAMPLHCQVGVGVSSVDVEARVVTLFYSSIVVVGVYVTCSGLGPVRDHKRVAFNKAFKRHLLRLKELGLPLLVVGDLNVSRHDCDVFDGAVNPSRKKWGGFKPYERKAFEELLNVVEVHDVFEKLGREEDRFTFHFNDWHRRRNQGWRLDYFLASADLLTAGSTQRPTITAMWTDRAALGLSDHLPVVCRIRNAVGIPVCSVPAVPLTCRGRLKLALEGHWLSFSTVRWPSWLLALPLSLLPLGSRVGILRGTTNSASYSYPSFVRALGCSVVRKAVDVECVITICPASDVLNTLERLEGVVRLIEQRTGVAVPWALFSDVQALHELGLLHRSNFRVILAEDWGSVGAGDAANVDCALTLPRPPVNGVCVQTSKVRCIRGAWICGRFPKPPTTEDRVLVERRYSEQGLLDLSPRLAAFTRAADSHRRSQGVSRPPAPRPPPDPPPLKPYMDVPKQSASGSCPVCPGDINIVSVASQVQRLLEFSHTRDGKDDVDVVAAFSASTLRPSTVRQFRANLSRPSVRRALDSRVFRLLLMAVSPSTAYIPSLTCPSVLAFLDAVSDVAGVGPGISDDHRQVSTELAGVIGLCSQWSHENDEDIISEASSPHLSNVPLIKPRLGGVPCWSLVDSGASHCIISQSKAREILGSRYDAAVRKGVGARFRGVHGLVQAVGSVCLNVQLGSGSQALVARNQLFWILPDPTPTPVILGGPLFLRYGICIDYNRKQLTWSRGRRGIGFQIRTRDAKRLSQYQPYDLHVVEKVVIPPLSCKLVAVCDAVGSNDVNGAVADESEGDALHGVYEPSGAAVDVVLGASGLSRLERGCSQVLLTNPSMVDDAVLLPGTLVGRFEPLSAANAEDLCIAVDLETDFSNEPSSDADVYSTNAASSAVQPPDAIPMSTDDDVASLGFTECLCTPLCMAFQFDPCCPLCAGTGTGECSRCLLACSCGADHDPGPSAATVLPVTEPTDVHYADSVLPDDVTFTSEGLPSDLQLDRGDMNLTSRQLEELKQVIRDHRTAFTLKYGHPGQVSGGYEACINTGDAAPVALPPRRVSPKERTYLVRTIADMLRAKVIEPASSPWNAAVVLVPKKDGKLRFCIDYRKLNLVTHGDVYSLPRIEDTLSALQGAKYFSSFDLDSGFWNIPIQESDREKTAFMVPSGQFQWRRMPFGLKNAPSIFQRFMDIVLAGVKWQFALVFIDDILVYSSTWKDHLAHLRIVLQRIIQFGLRLKGKKCLFCRKKVLYLGHVISARGIQPNPDKVKAIKAFKFPENVGELRRFLGLVGHYRRFIQHFARHAAPLYDML